MLLYSEPDRLGGRIKDLAGRARAKRLEPEDARGATFTIITTITRYDRVHLGIAVSLGADGLIVPVRDVARNRKNVFAALADAVNIASLGESRYTVSDFGGECLPRVGGRTSRRG